MMQQKLHSNSIDETRAIARGLAESLKPGAVLALHGDLGAGKTCFVQGLADGLGITEIVNSPTFTIVKEYDGDLPLYHIDLYRISDEHEALDLGLDEYLFGDGVAAVEWAERVEPLFPAHTVHIRFELETAAEMRTIVIDEGKQ